jgi:hypothetical protein
MTLDASWWQDRLGSSTQQYINPLRDGSHKKNEEALSKVSPSDLP